MGIFYIIRLPYLCTIIIKQKLKMNKIGVFYGSTTGTTEDVAHRIAEKLNIPH